VSEPAAVLADLGRCRLMGVLNVTPDSFSDGGRHVGVEAAVAHGDAMSREGADLVDVGGESTRPGTARIDAAEELRRVLPVVEALAGRGVAVSIDTTRACVARAALDAGAVLVNDVSGGLADPAMGGVVAAAGVPWVLMHWRGHSREMDRLATYDDVVAEVVAELRQRVASAVRAGVPEGLLLIDPGFGFAKTAAHNWTLLAHLDRLIEIGPPVLIGASRKGFLGAVLADPAGSPRPVEERETATVATTAVAALAGAWGVRVHEIGPNVDAVRTVAAIRRCR